MAPPSAHKTTDQPASPATVSTGDNSHWLKETSFWAPTNSDKAATATAFATGKAGHLGLGKLVEAGVVKAVDKTDKKGEGFDSAPIEKVVIRHKSKAGDPPANISINNHEINYLSRPANKALVIEVDDNDAANKSAAQMLKWAKDHYPQATIEVEKPNKPEQAAAPAPQAPEAPEANNFSAPVPTPSVHRDVAPSAPASGGGSYYPESSTRSQYTPSNSNGGGYDGGGNAGGYDGGGMEAPDFSADPEAYNEYLSAYRDAQGMKNGKMSIEAKAMVALIVKIARKRGCSPEMTKLLIATAIQESALNPKAIGDGGHSGGLFQENDAGRGKGLTMAQRQDPVGNINRAIDEFQQFASKGYKTPGELAVAAQRPAQEVRAGYIASINKYLMPQADQMYAMVLPTLGIA